ncbi:MAG: FkbM family methyltransferase [Robiginitomaculum sp.]|nr:MAG: FkbM family methyltransferase [Robiginitomaculum sp.]
MISKASPKFGHYALPAKREALRKRADKFASTRIGRLGISLYRKQAFKGLSGPFDVQVMLGVNARLYPRSNRCEKRAFAGVQIWDAEERAALAAALDASTIAPFIFLDVGANVGLYSLILAAHAKTTGKDIRIVAFEPDPANRARLAFNIKASEANIQVLPFAISDEDGEGFMGGGDINRGEIRLQDNVDDSDEKNEQPVQIKTLYGVCEEQGLSRIDAMKVDIEGHDERALTAFFERAPKALWPCLLILETGRDATTSLLELCTGHGYTITKRTGINSILVLDK